MPRRNWREGNQPCASTRSGISAGGNTAAPSITTRCSPTRRLGMVRARRTASAAAGRHHQAGGVQDAGAVRALDRLVDRLGEAEIVGGEEDASHSSHGSGRGDYGGKVGPRPDVVFIVLAPAPGAWADMHRAPAPVPSQGGHARWFPQRSTRNMRAVTLGFKSPRRHRKLIRIGSPRSGGLGDRALLFCYRCEFSGRPALDETRRCRHGQACPGLSRP